MRYTRTRIESMSCYGWRRARPHTQWGRGQADGRDSPPNPTQSDPPSQHPSLTCPRPKPGPRGGAERDPVHAHGHSPTPFVLKRPAGFPCGEGLCEHRTRDPHPPRTRRAGPRGARQPRTKLGHEPVVVSWPFQWTPHPGHARGARLSARVRP